VISTTTKSRVLMKIISLSRQTACVTSKERVANLVTGFNEDLLFQSFNSILYTPLCYLTWLNEIMSRSEGLPKPNCLLI